MASEKGNWLVRYGNGYHTWRPSSINGQKMYERPIGLVEYSFDTDGTEFGGRADMTATLTLEIRHSLSKDDLRQRIVLAWSNLRLQHVLLMARVGEDNKTGYHTFVVDVPKNMDNAFQRTMKDIVWLEDLYDEIDGQELHNHALNVARIINPLEVLSRLFVLPLVPLPNGNFELRLLIIMAHQISDGLSSYNWFNHLIRMLNMPLGLLGQEVAFFRSEENIASRLPPAQEDLYPKISGSKARQRWFWAIMRVLRHVQKEMPPTFVNPLRRGERRKDAVAFEPKFDKVFDYAADRRPPMNSGHIAVSLSKAASMRLIEICRSIKVSVGAGCFALAGISMMEIHEAKFPDIPDAERPAFAASFPLNPRAFFGFTTPADSCMLAFSEGIIMPSLPSSLPIEGRFKLIARHANRKLRKYQKRLKTTDNYASLGPQSPSRLLATGYLSLLERVNAKLPVNRKWNFNIQGSLPEHRGPYGATCGVSSVGSTAAFFRPGMFDLNDMEGKNFAADFRALRMGVRARENEFLIGSSTDSNGIVGFGVSYDLNAISEEMAETWGSKIKALLDRKGDESRL